MSDSQRKTVINECEDKGNFFTFLLWEMERLNEANPNLVRVNKNTWKQKE